MLLRHSWLSITISGLKALYKSWSRRVYLLRTYKLSLLIFTPPEVSLDLIADASGLAQGTTQMLRCFARYAAYSESAAILSRK